MKNHSGSTGETTTIKLTSSIEQVVWSRSAASPSATVGLEIFTHNVGNGSQLRIELMDGKGRKHGRFSEKVAGNQFWASIRVPPTAENALVATVKLPKHGLEMTSPALLLTPPVKIQNPTWSQEEARRGDVLTLTAEVKGAPDGTEAEIAIFEHDADGAHDLVTKLPAHVEGETVEAEWAFEYHDDTDDIPTAEEAEKGYQSPEFFFRVNVGGVEVSSELLHFKDWIEFEFRDVRQRPVEGVKATIARPDGTEETATSDADGTIVIEDARPGVYTIVSQQYPDTDDE